MYIFARPLPCKNSALVDQVNSRGATSTYNGNSNVYVVVICILEWKTKLSINRRITCLFVCLFARSFVGIVPP